MKSNLFIIIILISFSLKAQTNDEKLKESTNSTKQTTVAYTFDNRYEGIKGSPYIYEKWLKGTVLFLDKTIRKNVDIKFEALNNEVIYNKGGKEFILDKQGIKGIELYNNNDTLHFELLNYDDKLTYLRVLVKGKANLLLKYHKDLLKADYQDPYSANRRSDEIIDNNFYLLMLEDQSIVKVKINKRSILKNLSKQKNLIENYIKSNNIEIETETDLINIIKYYNTL